MTPRPTQLQAFLDVSLTAFENHAADPRSVASLARARAALREEMGGEACDAGPATPAARYVTDDALRVRARDATPVHSSRRRRLCAIAIDSGAAAVAAGVRGRHFDAGDVGALSCAHVASLIGGTVPLHRKTKRRRP